MHLEALRSGNFKLLDDAVTDWSTMVGKLKELDALAREGLHAKAVNANWAGVNAAVSRKFIGKTAGEFTDAHTQATSIHNILRDTRDELKDWQRKLNEAIDRGAKKNLTVTSTGGGGFTVSMNVRPDSAGDGTKVPSHAPKDAEALRDEVQGILNSATEVDSTAAAALKALVDLTKVGFGGANVKDRDSAAASLKDAEKLAALAKKDPQDLTAEEFDALNAGLKKHTGDELFAEHFAERLGPKGTLDFWAGINDPYVIRELGSKRADQYDDLQKHLSLTLAAATQADTPEMSEWKREMTNLGSQPLSKNNPTLGFQVMGNLMRWGNYDDQFLKEYGTELIKAEKKYTDNGRKASWASEPTYPLLNHTGSDSGYDPMTGFLKGLSNSPDAATDFFNDTFVTKDEDHEFERDTDGDKYTGKVGLTNFQYLFEERHWPEDTSDEGEDRSIEGRNNLALALEAAATGHPAGEMPTEDTPPHTRERAKLMESIVESVSDDPERLTKRGYMSDSIAQIASEYLPDINRATANPYGDPDDPKDDNKSVPKLFPITGSPAILSHEDVTRFLLSVGKNPEGYATIEVGQKAYMANLMDYHLNPNLSADQRYPQDAENTIKEISRRSGEVAGTLTLGRNQAVLVEAKQADEDFAHAMNQRKNVASGFAGLTLGVGASFIATPAVGAAVGGAANTVSGVVLEQIFKDSEPGNLKDAGQTTAKRWETSESVNIALSKMAAEEAAKAHRSPDISKVEEWTRTGTKDGFDDASTACQEMAKGLVTEIP
ncbi:hypothetical protein [Streptomyces sp. NPDC000410]|uniref:hypothetical protein n=1 Tax=Streptomyces sp. NPDC000410 TaxID=3154254 RepID=UPI0033217274